MSGFYRVSPFMEHSSTSGRWRVYTHTSYRMILEWLRKAGFNESYYADEYVYIEPLDSTLAPSAQLASIKGRVKYVGGERAAQFFV